MGNRIQRIAFPYPNPPNRFRTQPEYITNMYGDKIPVLYFPNLQKVADVEHVKEENVKDQKEKQEVKEQKGRNKLIIFSHGNATDLAASEEFLRHFGKQFQVSVLGYEYLGYGFSQPVVDNSTSINIQYPCEEGCYESLGMAWNYARKTLGYAAEDIILMGQSIGSGPTCEIAKRVSKKYKKESATFTSSNISNVSNLSKESSEEKSEEFSNSSNSYKNTTKALGGVILVSPFRTAAKVVTNNPLGYFVDFFCNEQKIHKIDAPILIIHGTSDSVIGCDHSEYMVNKCHESRTKEQQCNSVTLCLIKDADHNDIFFYDEMREAIRNFLDSHIADAN